MHGLSEERGMWEGVGCAEETSKPAASQGAIVEALASQECHAAELAS